MDQNNQQNNPVNMMSPEPAKDKLIGVVAVATIIVVVLIVGVYMFVVSGKKTEPSQETQAIPATSSSETSSIEAELNTIDLGNDAELDQLEKGL